jgi:hypothetical protein
MQKFTEHVEVLLIFFVRLAENVSLQINIRFAERFLHRIINFTNYVNYYYVHYVYSNFASGSE